ncbi:MAG: hypothetical protein ACI4J0_07805 [Huintestinicola sp.]|uniref:hypothetical protein n=1 Tax=Huintestinicola sp. TaxID=2981661 RepID=UPI003F0A9C63
MKLHLSVDDVICSLMDLCSQAPNSVFDIPFWCLLRDLNEKYGAVFTIYAFENYAESFHVNCIPKQYWAEFADCKFIRFGFHGVFRREKNDFFERQCIGFYSCFPEALRADTIRLHRYEADPSMIGILRRYGVSAILCREDESRKINDFPPSYMFTENEEKRIGTVPVKINGISFVKTSLRIELHEKNQLLQELNELISKSSDDAIIAVFTHEKFVSEYSDSIDAVCRLVNKHSNIDFTF